MATVCLGSKYHSSMSRGVRANEHYLLWICTGSQSSVTFYDAYLRSAASPCSDLLALSSRVSYTAALHTRLSKVQLGRFRVVLAGFIQSVRSLYVFTTLRRERSFSWGKSQESQLTQLCFPFFFYPYCVVSVWPSLLWPLSFIHSPMVGFIIFVALSTCSQWAHGFI